MRKKSLIVLLAVISFNFSYSQAILNADGEGETYELINSVLAPDGGNVVEVPDCGHEEFGRHIDEVYDSILQMYVFRFYMHVTPDNDRCKYFDRQRNEIKTYDQSPDSLLAVVGETHEYKWKFKLDSGFQSSSSFTHIHQLKAVGGSYESMPLITLTTRLGSPDKLELRYAAAASQSTIEKIDLTPLKGVWVQAVEVVKFGNPGEYSLKLVKIETDEVLYEYSDAAIKMWKDGANFIRPKWGLYRSLNYPERLRDEILFFADFYIKETQAVIEPDTIRPTVLLSTLATEPVSDEFEVSIVFSEEVNGFAEDDIDIQNAIVKEGSLTTVDNIEYAVVVIPDTTGIVMVSIAEGKASDEAGNENEASNDLEVQAEIANSIIQPMEKPFSIYPNPTSGSLNISISNEAQFVGVDLFDQSGRNVVSKMLNVGSMSIDVSGLNDGIYFLQLSLAGKAYYDKIIVN